MIIPEMNDPKEKLKYIVAYSSDSSHAIYGTGIWRTCHQLADMKYRPAYEFFERMLDDPRWDWREVSISLLGYHYDLDAQTLEKIRNLTIHDQDDGVRLSAVCVLGYKGRMPEPNLIKAMKVDPNKLVREAAFEGLLNLCGVSFKTVNSVRRLVHSGKLNPTLDEVRRIVVQEGGQSCLDYLRDE